MSTYTLNSYEPVNVVLPKPQVPESLVDSQIEKLLEPLADYIDVEGGRPVAMGDFLIVTTENPCIDGNPAKHLAMEHSLYHVGAGEMPRSFDDGIVGMAPGETRAVQAQMRMPLAKDGEASALTMRVTVERIMTCRQPELTDDLVKEHFAPATTVAEFRAGVAGQFGLPDMAKSDPQFPDLVLNELAKRLMEEPDPDDRLEGQPLDALRVTCAVDALADHLGIELTDEEITAQMPGDDAEQRAKIRRQLDDQGMGNEAYVFARREAALSWLVNNSRVSYE